MIHSRNQLLSFTGSDKLNQFFQIIEIIIITHNPFPVIDNSCLLISLQTVQQSRKTVSSRKFCKCPCFDLFRIESFATAFRRTFIAAVQSLFNHTFSVFAPFCIFTP